MQDPVGERTLEIMNKAANYNNWLYMNIKNYISGDILEVGSGIGNFTDKFVKLGRVWATDFNKEYVDYLNKRYKGKVKAGFADIEKSKYFFKNQKFDSIVNMNVLEHIKDDNMALKNMFNLLNRNGKLILLTPAHMSMFGEMDVNLGHYRRYTKQGLAKQFKKQGFSVVHCEYLNPLGAAGWFVNSKILKRKIIPQGLLKLFDVISPPLLWLEKIIKPPFGLSVLIIGEKK